MKAFISYSTKDKAHAASVKAVLDQLGIDGFLAHENIKVSEPWKKRILTELRACKIFVPLLSRSFKRSNWCGQEVGLIVRRRGVLTIPLSLDGTNSYGFIEHLQTQKLPRGSAGEHLVLEAMAKQWPGFVIDKLLGAVKTAYSFRAGEAAVKPLVPFFPKFSKEQIRRFMQLVVENGQVWDAHLCRDEYLPAFLKMHRDAIPKRLYRALKHQLKTHQFYREAA